MSDDEIKWIERELNNLREDMKSGFDEVKDMITAVTEKVNQYVRDTQDDFDSVHGRITKVENRVSRIEGIGGALQFLWGALIAFLGRR